jgi:hypothetical protein
MTPPAEPPMYLSERILTPLHLPGNDLPRRNGLPDTQLRLQQDQDRIRLIRNSRGHDIRLPDRAMSVVR